MLTGKQKRYLRGMAVTMKSTFQIGKDGLSNNLYTALNDYLKANELVKVSILKSCDTPLNEIEIELLAHLKCELVQQIGRTLILYKRSKDNKIILP